MYAKLFASLYQGTLRGNGDAILVFTNLLAHADYTGAVDKHFRAIADEVGLSLERVKAAIEFLESPDEESRSPECDGRRIIPLDEHRAWGWQIVNHGKYRAIRNEDDRREQNREAQKRWRERQQAKAERNDDISNISSVSQDKPIQIQKQIQKKKERERGTRSASGIPVNPEVDETLDAFLSKVRKIYNTNVLSNEQRWVTAIIEADQAGITPEQFASSLSTLLADKTRKFPVTPQNVIDLALNERAKKTVKSKPADGKPVFAH